MNYHVLVWCWGRGSGLLWSIQRANTTDGNILQAVVANESFPTFYGDLVFDANGQNSAGTLLLQYDGTGGEVQAVYPIEVAAMSLVYPAPSWGWRDCVKYGNCSFPSGHCTTDGECECSGAFLANYENGQYACNAPDATDDCAAGEYYSVVGTDSFTCTSCDPGSYQPDSNSLAAQCTLCPVSTYAPSTGMAQCLECGDWLRQTDGSERRKGSFSITSGADACTSCPNGADCYDGEDVIVRKNWWRNSRETLLIRQCTNDYCGGGPLSRLDNQCLQNHTGALCMLCADPFTLNHVDGSCVLCEKGDKQKEQVWMGIWASIFVVTGGTVFVAVRKCSHMAHE